jgi:hypothetical protein
MNKYHEGKIYKLINCVDNKEYVGSTHYTLDIRLGRHLSSSSKLNSKVYIHFKNIGWNNAEIKLVENFKCENRTELRIREQYWIEELKPELNTNKAYITEEYLIDYKKKYSKKYRKENPEKEKERHKKYQKENKEAQQLYRHNYYDEHKDDIKKYNSENKETHQLYRHNYYKEKNKEIINCECGGKYRFTSKSTHFKTKKHQKHLSTIQQS